MSDRIDKSALHALYRTIDDFAGTDIMLQFWQTFNGLQLNVPAHLYDRELAAKRILEEYNGSNLQSLATTYGYSQKWVRQIIATAKKDGNIDKLK